MLYTDLHDSFWLIRFCKGSYNNDQAAESEQINKNIIHDYISINNWNFGIMFYICRVNNIIVDTMSLSKAEEQIMEQIWKHEKVFLKELIDALPEPRPASTTVVTLLKRMQDKGFVAYTLFGNSRQYYPLVAKAAYFSDHVNGLIKNFFNNSAAQFGSFFARDTNLSTQELEQLREIINDELNRKNND